MDFKDSSNSSLEKGKWYEYSKKDSVLYQFQDYIGEKQAFFKSFSLNGIYDSLLTTEKVKEITPVNVNEKIKTLEEVLTSLRQHNFHL